MINKGPEYTRQLFREPTVFYTSDVESQDIATKIFRQPREGAAGGMGRGGGIPPRPGVGVGSGSSLRQQGSKARKN
jgi:hypothetical protein